MRGKVSNEYDSNDFGLETWVQNQLRLLPKGSKILDAGAGEQRYRRYCSNLQYTSQDFCQYNGNTSDGRGLDSGNWDTSHTDIVCDITEIPVANDEFDAVLCTEVFEHIPDPIKALKELMRVLKKGGVLILTAPFCSLTHMAPYHYYSGYNRYWYEKWIAEFGGKIELLEPNGNYYRYIEQELCRLTVISKKYSQSNLNIFTRIVVKCLQFELHKLEKKYNNSSELLAFGYMCVATKS